MDHRRVLIYVGVHPNRDVEEVLPSLPDSLYPLAVETLVYGALLAYFLQIVLDEFFCFLKTGFVFVLFGKFKKGWETPNESRGYYRPHQNIGFQGDL